MTYKRLPANTPAILRAAGLVVIEVDGWQKRGRPATTGELDPVGVLCHHTATGPKSSNAAVVNLLVKGREGLPGPLSQFGLRRDGAVYLIASGRCNHAGKAKKSGTVGAGDGNKLYWGIEAFNDGRGEPWGKAQMEAYALLCAVLSVKFTKNSVNTVRAHKETSITGKIDPTFNMTTFRTNVQAKMTKLEAPAVPARPLPTGVKMPVPVPSKWQVFTHLDPKIYMDYYKAIVDAGKRTRNKAVDVDVKRSKQGTPWGLHWGNVEDNRLHDPKKLIKGSALIEDLTDAQISRLRSSAGKRPHKLQELLELAADNGVRVEAELKTVIDRAHISALFARPKIKAMHVKGRLQFKSLAALSSKAVGGPLGRLKPAQDAGGVTILSWTGYTGKGLKKSYGYPVVDYQRGKSKWI